MPTALQNNVAGHILCESNMAVMKGLEFMRQIATVESAQDVPVVTIANDGGEAHVAQALSAGVGGYIRKPFTPNPAKKHVFSLLKKKP